MALLRCLTLVCAFPCALALVDYCDIDKRTYSESSPGIQLTRELSTWEYGVQAKFKSLHCCSKGYRSIEWFKDGKAYPWAIDMSSFILFPESANQTIYTPALGPVDTGKYTCVVTKLSEDMNHTITLTVFDTKKNYMDMPLKTYDLAFLQHVEIGNVVRVYCEAFVGKIDLPDANSEAWWTRTGFNMSSPEVKRYQQNREDREDGQVVGTYLTIESVRRSDLGQYICSISNTQDQVLKQMTYLVEEESQVDIVLQKVPWRKVYFIVLVTICFVGMLLAAYKQFALSVKLYIKTKFRPRCVDDGKKHDVVICHSIRDAKFSHAMARVLHHRYGYIVTLCQLNTARVSADLRFASSASRRVLAVLSPSLFDCQWSPLTISPFLKELTEIHSSIILVSKKVLLTREWLKTDEGVALSKLLIQTSVLVWKDKTPIQRQHVWTSLRLSLPSPQTAGTKTPNQTTLTMYTNKTLEMSVSV